MSMRADNGRFRPCEYFSLANGRDGGSGYDATAQEHADGTATARVRRMATAIAKMDQNYDHLAAADKNPGKPYCLTGPGIEDSYFGTVMELVSLLVWLCRDGYLSDFSVPKGGTYANQTAVLAERTGFPFIPFA